MCLPKNKVKVFGPNKYASKLEGSKSFVKNLCKYNKIPTADFKICTNKNQEEGERMVEIARDLRILLRTWEPKLAAVEKYLGSLVSQIKSYEHYEGIVFNR